MLSVDKVTTDVIAFLRFGLQGRQTFGPSPKHSGKVWPFVDSTFKPSRIIRYLPDNCSPYDFRYGRNYAQDGQGWFFLLRWLPKRTLIMSLCSKVKVAYQAPTSIWWTACVLWNQYSHIDANCTWQMSTKGQGQENGPYFFSPSSLCCERVSCTSAPSLI